MSTASATSLRYAGFWRRLLAFVVDAALFTVLLLPVFYLIYGPDYFAWHAANEGRLGSYGFIDALLSYVLPLVLLVLFWSRMSATPGKLLLECRVVDAATLQAPSPKQALYRALAYIVSALPLYLGFAWMAWDRRKQGWHDKLANTLVLHVPDDDSQVPLDEWLRRFRQDPAA